jgi:hypothetical protein
VEECLAYFRDAIHRPASVPPWADWWARHEPLVRQSLSRLEYLRLRARGLAAAEDYLRRTGQLLDPVRLDPEFIRLLQSIDWLAKCGRPMPSPPEGVTRAETPGDAVAAARLPGTAALRQGPLIEMFNHVAAADPESHARWNDRAKALNAWLDASGLEALWEARLAAVGAGLELVPGIRSDVLLAWLGHEHRAVAGCPTDHERLFSWYRLGRVVCGWAGDWPDGSLVVY